ncbi:maestro heat-like repeat-containing protein family member 7 [Calonectris borealis]|uniref:maestro heat-like repeat-containing protein family member 7 n=1 Tax=Calonectris borealis TaxID=1323832 RepID=UPI003F4C0759
MSRCLVELLSRKEPRWELSAMAFLVELLACHDTRDWDEYMLLLSLRYLQSERRVMHRLVLRVLIMLCRRPVTVNRMQFLLPSLMEVLQDADGEVVEMTLYVISKVVRATPTPIASSVALQLAERLRPLFDSDINFVQLLSMYLFRDVMEFVAEAGKKLLKTHVHQSLLPLLCHSHDENQRVAEASRKTLLEATKFLKKRKLEQLLEREETWAVGECLLAEHSSRADEYLHQCLRYLQSPQESMRVASIRILVLQGMQNDISLPVRCLASQTLLLVRTAERIPPSRLRVLQVRLRRAWRRRPSLQGNGWLCCWSSVQT